MASTKTKILNYFKDNAGSYVYVFIHRDAAHLFNGQIQNKRLRQQEYVTQSAQLSSLTYNNIVNTISTEIKRKYGKTPAECLKLLCEGKRVFATDGSGSTVGKTPYVGAVNITTGFPESYKFSNNGVDHTTSDGRYSRIIDCETSAPICVIDNTTGQTVSKWNSQTNKYEAGTLNAKDKSDWWVVLQQSIPFIMSFLEWLYSLFTGKQSVTAMGTAARQGDGWSSANGRGDGFVDKKNNDLMTILIIGGIAYLALKDKK